MKYILFAALALFCIFSFSNHKNEKPHHVVLQLTTNDTSAWKLMMNNIKNLKISWDDDVYIEVVAFGPGLDFLTTAKATEQKQVAEFAKKGVKFVACENSMKAKNIHKSDLIDNAGTVPSGVRELVQKQEDGWTYLKAGY
jgi:intracellular sulfur oxidation DsrE/DsrF family protein